MTSDGPVVVIGVIGNDIHVVANRVLEICLREAGFHPINLGSNNKPDDFADAALETGAQAALIGSLNGEAPHWCRGLRQLFEERGVGNTLIYLGGNVVVGDLPKDEVRRALEGSGVDRVYHGKVDFDSVIATLREDLERGRSEP